MEIDFRDIQFPLISYWKIPGFERKFRIFLLLKVTYLLDKEIVFDTLFFKLIISDDSKNVFCRSPRNATQTCELEIRREFWSSRKHR